MTIFGAVAIDGETALAWSDSAVFSASAGAPIGHVPKVALNALACMAGVGAGWNAIAVESANALTASLGLDELVEELPARLRRVAFRTAAAMERLDPGSFATCIFAAVGWSRQAGRMLVFEFAAASAFEPRMTTSVIIPDVPPLVVPADPDWFNIAYAAADQVRTFRRDVSEMTGALVAAVIRPGAIETRVWPDFAAGPTPAGATASGAGTRW